MSKIAKNMHWVIGDVHINEIRFCRNNRFKLKGNWGVCRSRFSFLDFVVSGRENIFLLYSSNLLIFRCKRGNFSR
jgi:hypothetical protein